MTRWDGGKRCWFGRPSTSRSPCRLTRCCRRPCAPSNTFMPPRDRLAGSLIAKCSCWRSCLPPRGLSPDRWPRICPGYWSAPVPPMSRQLPRRHWSGRRRWRHAWSSSCCCATYIRWCRSGSPRSFIRSERQFLQSSGPPQVSPPLVEFVLLRNVHPLVSARFAALLHPLGAAIFAVVGPAAVVPFTLFYGAGNGLMTIARGTVPLAVFGPHGYGERTGLLGAPSRAAQALAPLLFGLMLDAIGPAGIAVSSELCLAAFAALLLLRAAPVQQREADAQGSGRN